MAKTSEEHTTGYALERVPGKARIGTYSLSTTWMGWIFYMGGPFIGALIAAKMNPTAAITAIIAGNVLLFFFVLLNGEMGAKLGLSVSMCSRYSFGNIGTIIPSLIYFITLAGWFAVSIGVLAVVMNGNVGGAPWLWSLIMGLIMTAMAAYGMKVIAKLAFYVAPAILILMVVGFILALTKMEEGKAFLPQAPFAGNAWLLAFGLTISHWIVGASLAPDVMRFGKSQKSVAWAGFWGFVIANNVIMLLGVFTSWALGTTDFFVAMPGLAGIFWKILAMATIIGIVWTSGDCQCYTSGLALSNITKLDSRIATCISGVIGLLLAISGIYGYAISWLLFMGIFVPGVPAIMIVDYYIRHKQRYPDKSNIIVKANWNAIIAYAIGVVAEYLMTNVWGVGIFAVNSIVITGIAYLILSKANPVNVFDSDAPSVTEYYIRPEEQAEMDQSEA